MARKALNYDNLAIVEDEVPSAARPASSAVAEASTPLGEAAGDSELLRDVAHQTMMYLHTEGVRALDEYALAKSTLHRKIKRHDLILEAIEEWAAKRGIKAQFRAKERKFKAKRRYVVINE
jgi:hypothetical protein